MSDNLKVGTNSRVERAIQRARDRNAALPGFSITRNISSNETDREKRFLGEILVDQGKLDPEQVDRILEHARKKNLSFGDAAVDLRLISRSDQHHAVAEQFDYPYLLKGAGGHSQRLVAAYDPFSKKGQRYRNLRAQLLLHWEGAHRKTLAVVTPLEPEASYLIAANLAVAFSQSGTRTLFVDADFSPKKRGKLFNVPTDGGLSSLLLGRVTLNDAARKLEHFRSLFVLPSGALPPNPGDLLARQQWANMVAEMRREFQVVIFNSPPFKDNAGAEIIVRRCGSALLAIQRNRTYISDLRALQNILKDSGADIVGSVLLKS